MKKAVKIILPVVILVCVIVAVAVGYNTINKDINGTENKKAIEYTLIINHEDFQYQVAEKLANNGIVVSDAIWSLWMDKYYPNFVYINGEYNMRSDMTYDEIADKLQNPDISHKTVSVCIPEGYNVFDIAKTLEDNGICSKEDFFNAVSTTEGYDYEWLSQVPVENKNLGFALEGFLFPATYDWGENMHAMLLMKCLTLLTAEFQMI